MVCATIYPYICIYIYPITASFILAELEWVGTFTDISLYLYIYTSIHIHTYIYN